MNEKQYPKVILYGFGDASKAYACLYYTALYAGEDTIPMLKREATLMKTRNPSIAEVYAVESRKGLVYDYRDAVRQNTVESNVIFKTMCEQEGLRAD